MSHTTFSVIVVGASAGGLSAITKLMSPLPPKFPAAILVVQHMAADTTGDVLVNRIAENCPLPCGHAESGELIVPARIFIAPPDHHLLISHSRIVVSKGAGKSLPTRYRSAFPIRGRRIWPPRHRGLAQRLSFPRQFLAETDLACSKIIPELYRSDVQRPKQRRKATLHRPPANVHKKDIPKDTPKSRTP